MLIGSVHRARGANRLDQERCLVASARTRVENHLTRLGAERERDELRSLERDECALLLDRCLRTLARQRVKQRRLPR